MLLLLAKFSQQLTGALAAIVGQRPLVIVPYITIAQEGVRKRNS